MQGRDISVNDIAASYQAAILDVIIQKSVQASIEFGQELCSGDAKGSGGADAEGKNGSGTRPKLVVAGGVAANSALRKGLTEAAEENGIDLYIPDPILCTDNGAMIGAAAYYKYRASGPDDLTLDAYADLEM